MTNPAQAPQAAKAKKKVPQTFLGISISSHKVEVASIQPSRDVEATPHKIIKSVSYTLADGILSYGGDVVQDPNALGQIISSLVDQVKPKSRVAHLSIPGTLLRFTEMPKMQPKELYLSLSSEAERYKIFDDTEAAVDFSTLDIPGTPANQQKLVFGAVRNDTLNAYKQILKIAKIKIASIDLEPLNVLRGMAGTAVLNSLVQQIGPTAYWGTILVEPERVRLLLWQGSNLVDLREFQMETKDFQMGDPNSYVISDLLDEIQRTTKTNQPAIWLTYRMPEVADKILSERLNIPVRSCLIGPAITQDQPDLMVSTVGTALRSLVSFPFDFDILTSSKLYAAPTNKPDNSKNKEMLITLGIFGGGGLTAISLVIWILMIGYLELWLKNSQLNEATAARDKVKTEVDNKMSAIQLIQGESQFVKQVKKSQEDTNIRNNAFVGFVEDLKEKTPSQVWVSKIKVDEKLSLEGKAIEHQGPIDLAKSFDGVDYASNIYILSIKEGLLGGNHIYKFKLKGKLKLSPKLLQDSQSSPMIQPIPEPAPDPAAASSTPPGSTPPTLSQP